MSKKKFKKFSKAEIMAELARVNPEAKKEQTEAVRPRERMERVEIIQKENPSSVPDFSKNTKTDLKKIGLLFGSLTLVLIVIDFVSMKTDLVNNLGNFLFKIFHLY